LWPADIERNKQVKRSIGIVISPCIDLQLSAALAGDRFGTRLAFWNLACISQSLQDFRDECLP
jgi:hypothetical protein